MPLNSSKFLRNYGYDILLGSIAAFYAIMVPFTKVEESFNVQAMHDILYHRLDLHKYDHLEFPGVVPRTFIGAFIVSGLAAPVVAVLNVLHLPKFYSLIAVRLALGCIVLWTLRFLRNQIKNIFGHQVEAFFVILTAFQFHLLFYVSRPLPNILALAVVNLAHGYSLRGDFYKALYSLIFATFIFRCDILLLICPFGFELLLTKRVTLWRAIKCCSLFALFCVGLTVLVDSIMWKKLLWPEFEVFWFNSVLNRSSEWGVVDHTCSELIKEKRYSLKTYPFHWYFTSALPRALLAAYPLCTLGVFFDRRVIPIFIPVFFFVILYSKLPHKELRFIISSVPVFNLSAATAANRIYNNRKKPSWKLLYVAMIGLIFISLGCTVITFMASYQNYPSGYAIKKLHQIDGFDNDPNKYRVHIDTFSAMNGISRFCENSLPWRYSKEEEIPLEEFRNRNFTFLINEHQTVDGFKCLFAVKGFSRIGLLKGVPPIVLVKVPKVFVHGNVKNEYVMRKSWSGCA